ncbi:hypothetical protein [Botrimarina sp.]|uniref:hypothetical protein n=1 Tax=Botrimarina sp. TaxID=2795802 RepID=UPI0032EB30D3
MVTADRRRRSIPLPASAPTRVRREPGAASPNARVVGRDGRAIPRDSLERLERLDDAVFAALAGDPDALDAAAGLLHEASGAVDRRLLNETRQHYIRRARSRWRRAQGEPSQRLTLGFAAEEILNLLRD